MGRGDRNLSRRRNSQQRNAQRKRYYDQTAFAPLGWSRWTAEDVELVMAHEIPDRELARKLGRSVAAIQVRRAKEKKR